jgi:hypothetical protein
MRHFSFVDILLCGCSNRKGVATALALFRLFAGAVQLCCNVDLSSECRDPQSTPHPSCRLRGDSDHHLGMGY